MKKRLILEWWHTNHPTTPRCYAHLRSPNGQILLVSEGYNSPSGVRKLTKALRAAGLNLTVQKAAL